MDNENMDVQGNENLTPEEKVQADISEKIADAAEEVKEEINDANAELEANLEDSIQPVAPEEYNEEAELPAVKEPKKITVNIPKVIISLVIAALIGAAITLLVINVPKWINAKPDGNTIATVEGEAITDLDLNSYMIQEAMTYVQNNNIGIKSYDDLAAFDWDKEVDGVKLSDKLKQQAFDKAVSDLILVNKARANGVKTSQKEKDAIKLSIESQFEKMSDEDKDYALLSLRVSGSKSIKQYERTSIRQSEIETANSDFEENPDKYYPEDKSVLKGYEATNSATVKHILIMTSTETAPTEAPAEGEQAPAPEDKRAIAESALSRAKSGEDFDALVAELNEDPGQKQNPEGYTFSSGEMMPEFEKAAFALKIDEISDIVETSYGYHIIKRLAGINDLKNYWKEQSQKNININDKALAKVDFKAVIKDLADAYAELQLKQSK